MTDLLCNSRKSCHSLFIYHDRIMNTKTKLHRFSSFLSQRQYKLKQNRIQWTTKNQKFCDYMCKTFGYSGWCRKSLLHLKIQLFAWLKELPFFEPSTSIIVPLEKWYRDLKYIHPTISHSNWAFHIYDISFPTTTFTNLVGEQLLCVCSQIKTKV